MNQIGWIAFCVLVSLVPTQELRATQPDADGGGHPTIYQGKNAVGDPRIVRGEDRAACRGDRPGGRCPPDPLEFCAFVPKPGR